MSIPVFLRKSKEGGASGSSEPVMRKPDDDGADYDMLESAADDLLAAIASGDSKSVAAALRAAFEICDSEPHSEGPPSED